MNATRFFSAGEFCSANRFARCPSVTGNGSRRWRAGRVLIVIIAIWLSITVAGLAWMSRYEHEPGTSAVNAPVHWPHASGLNRVDGKACLVMFAHPKCPCTRASIGELAKIVRHCHQKVVAHVVFIRPATFANENDWEKTSLWRSANQIPGVSVISDDNLVETNRFAARTSGQTLLYNANGLQVFRGGVTSSRGHSGDNDGASAITDLILGRQNPLRQTRVFGCALTTKSKTNLAEIGEKG